MLASNRGKPIRVLIADDHEVVRIGIGKLLDNRPDIEVVGLARDGAEAIALCSELAPDVVLMDLVMPGIDGVDATRRIARTAGGPRVVVLTSFADREHISEALDSGAAGYLLKDSGPDELVSAVRAAAAGESPLTPRVALTVVRSCAAPRRPRRSATASARCARSSAPGWRTSRSRCASGSARRRSRAT